MNEYAELARLRQGCYRVLSAGYGPPSAERVGQIGAGVALLADMGLDAFAHAPVLRAWVGVLERTPLDLVATEHVRLFGSGIDGALIPPVESQHLGENLQGDPARHAARIEDLMRRAGVELRNDDKPPDHLLVELELASALCGAEASDRAAGVDVSRWLEMQRELIVVMARWISGFASKVADRDACGALAALAAATEAFVIHESDMLRLLPAETGGTA
ncbi:MAG: molecular chaperone TorD family protein [Acidimicrobiia bacterium]